ncbi:MAG TPA: FAD-dependent oxidoreductase, partial [Polyangiales bacterium]|nr:FAD-dependent oxidoreductase [Polyangiales bacterium]
NDASARMRFLPAGRHVPRREPIMNALDQLPIVVVGAGPVGLAAAAQLATRGIRFLVLEASDGVAASFKSTAHVALFSPWKMNIDAAAARVLEQRGWSAPDPDAMPTAGEVRSRYLEPLAEALAPHVHYGTRVERISRRGFDKVKSEGRERAPFVLRVRSHGRIEEREARAVIDATGTWGSPNWMGANGLPALGEEEHAARIRYGMPDVLGDERERYANQHVLVVGSGHSAMGSLLALAKLAEREARTRIAWAIRGDNLQRIFGGGAKDGLSERGNLGLALQRVIDGGSLELLRAFQIESVSEQLAQLEVVGMGADGSRRTIAGLDQIVVATGARPDLTLARELRLRLDPWLESTEQLAPLIDPNVHSCGSVPPHGHRQLAHPEPDYYAIGAKSYGRAPNFLLATGYEQARSVVAALAGDLAAADDVQLVLPETGVCTTDFADNTSCGGGSCETPASPRVTSGCCPVGENPAASACSPAAKKPPASSGCCG